MSSLEGGDFDTGDAQHIRVSGKFHRPLDVIVIGYRNPDTQIGCTPGDFRYRVGTVRVATVKMKVDDGILTGELLEVGFFKTDFMGLKG